jgi:hypothetical protein
MAITAKPTSYALDSGHAKAPTHLWMLDEGTGTADAAQDKGTGTALHMDLQNSAMWTTDAGDLESTCIECVSASTYYAASNTGTVWDVSGGNVLMWAIVKTASSTAPASGEYAIGYGHSTDSTAYGGCRAVGDGVSKRVYGIADDGPNTRSTGAFALDVWDQAWHLVAVKMRPSASSAVIVNCSVDGGAWNSATNTLGTAYSLNRYGLGCRPQGASPGGVFNGLILAAGVHENATWTDWDDAWIASLYSDPWQFLTTTQAFQYQQRLNPLLRM